MRAFGNRGGLAAAWLLLAAAAIRAEERAICLYQDSSGKTVQVNSIQDVPAEMRGGAHCWQASQEKRMQRPEDVRLDGPVRRENMNSPLGPVRLQWARSVERLFGRTPARAMTEAGLAMSRALRQGGFPAAVRHLSVDWQVVFMDESVPEKQIPADLVSNCHPGWMVPPADVYIVGQRVAAGCGGQASGKGVADGELMTVLLHEMGHALEFRLLGDAFFGERMRAEGFATWFAAFAADYSSLPRRKGAEREETFALARSAPANPAGFSGSAEDYARAAMIFYAVAARRGVAGIMLAYEALKRDRAGLAAAVKSGLGWNEDRLGQEIERVLDAGK